VKNIKKENNSDKSSTKVEKANKKGKEKEEAV